MNTDKQTLLCLSVSAIANFSRSISSFWGSKGRLPPGYVGAAWGYSEEGGRYLNVEITPPYERRQTPRPDILDALPDHLPIRLSAPKANRTIGVVAECCTTGGRLRNCNRIVDFITQHQHGPRVVATGDRR